MVGKTKTHSRDREFLLKDFLQVIIGASILSVPVGFTEETWLLGNSLPWLNTGLLLLVSVLFIGAFTYYYYHHKHIKGFHKSDFIKRLFLTYILSFVVVATLLTIIQAAPWATDLTVAVKRTIIVTFPASMSAAVADTFH